MGGRFSLFVYGTLKREQSNHDRYCRGFLDVEEATVRGWLYDLPFGFPALMVPGEDVLAAGTADHAADAATQRGMEDAAGLVDREAGPVVHGELFSFDDAEERLPALDRLEGFDPKDPGLYKRVVIPIMTAEAVVPAWAYVTGKPSGVYLPGGLWPAQKEGPP